MPADKPWGFASGNNEADWEPFGVKVNGYGLTIFDRITIISFDLACGSETTANTRSEYLDVIDNSLNARGHFTSTNELDLARAIAWDKLKIRRGGKYRVCMCPNCAGSEGNVPFQVDAGTFDIHGRPSGLASEDFPVATEVTLDVMGVGLTPDDRLLIADPDYDCGNVITTADVTGQLFVTESAGQSRNSQTAAGTEAGNLNNLVQYSNIKFTLGGPYKICWCAIYADGCARDKFTTTVGQIDVHGYLFAVQTTRVKAGTMATMSLAVVGMNYQWDQVRVVSGDVDCATHLGTRWSDKVPNQGHGALQDPQSSKDGEGASSSSDKRYKLDFELQVDLGGGRTRFVSAPIITRRSCKPGIPQPLLAKLWSPNLACAKSTSPTMRTPRI